MIYTYENGARVPRAFIGRNANGATYPYIVYQGGSDKFFFPDTSGTIFCNCVNRDTISSTSLPCLGSSSAVGYAQGIESGYTNFGIADPSTGGYYYWIRNRTSTNGTSYIGSRGGSAQVQNGAVTVNGKELKYRGLRSFVGKNFNFVIHLTQVSSAFLNTNDVLGVKIGLVNTDGSVSNRSMQKMSGSYTYSYAITSSTLYGATFPVILLKYKPSAYIGGQILGVEWYYCVEN